MRTIFAKYNRERLPQFQTVTKIVVDKQGKQYALKQALYPEGKRHIYYIYKNYKLLKSHYGKINFIKPIVTKEGDVLFEIASGYSLEYLMLNALEEGNKGLFLSYFEKFLNFINSMVEEKDVIFEPTKDFEKVFGKWESKEKQDIIKIANNDLIFGNIFIDEKGEFTVIDYEWVFNFKMPKDYIIWRSLFIFSLHHSIDIFKIVNLSGLSMSKFTKMEDSFNKFVHGDNKYVFSLRAKPALSVNLEKIVQALN